MLGFSFKDSQKSIFCLGLGSCVCFEELSPTNAFLGIQPLIIIVGITRALFGLGSWFLGCLILYNSTLDCYSSDNMVNLDYYVSQPKI